jgi:polyadenylation factor subunit 2
LYRDGSGRELEYYNYYTFIHYLDSMATAGPSRRGDTWQPTRYLEPNKPDNEEVLEQAAYQAAVTKHGGDNRARRYKPRRTVDYMGPMTKWRIDAKLKAVDYMAAVHPNPSDLIGVSAAPGLSLMIAM